MREYALAAIVAFVLGIGLTLWFTGVFNDEAMFVASMASGAVVAREVTKQRRREKTKAAVKTIEEVRENVETVDESAHDTVPDRDDHSVAGARARARLKRLRDKSE